MREDVVDGVVKQDSAGRQHLVAVLERGGIESDTVAVVVAGIVGIEFDHREPGTRRGHLLQ
jgi:hypothetical protein